MEKRFNAFNGVFLPAFLTIIGVIYYLRLGWVVGNAGLVGAIMIIVIAHIITISTAFSMSSIVTNMNVKGGGAYYLISRSLGLEIGGSIGIPLYLSQTISVALYVLGFVESVRSLNPNINPLILAVSVTVIIGIISLLGAELAIKAQYLVFGLIILSLITIFFSGTYDNKISTISSFEEGQNFWTVFSMFFPAVTGILAGVSMSGDLKNPKSDIPKGTFWAIGITFFIYIFQALWFKMNVSTYDLINDKLIIIKAVRFGKLVVAGIWAATLSSALGSIISAPRTMQALAKDGVLPRFLGKGSGKANEPRIASMLTFGIAFIFILMGKLSLVAPIITMFFLNTYGAVNLVCSLETIVGNPSYRPIFKTPWYVSLVGGIGSYLVMFLINKWATIMALIITAGVYFYLSNKRIARTWGDLRTGIWITLARFSLLKVRFSEENESKNWKPDILVFSGNPKQRSRLIYLANMLSKGKGIITLLTYVLGDIKNKTKTRESVLKNMNKYLEKRNIMAFTEVIVAKNFKDAATSTVQANGIGVVKPNTVLIGLTENNKNIIDYVEFIDNMVKIRKNVLILKYNKIKRFGDKKRIDIWWGGLENNGRLMLILAHILSLNDDWKNVEIRVMTIVGVIEKSNEIKMKLDKMLEEARIQADVHLIESNERKVTEIIYETSEKSDLVILGLANPVEGMEKEYISRIHELTENLPTTLLVKGNNIEKLV